MDAVVADAQVIATVGLNQRPPAAAPARHAAVAVAETLDAHASAPRSHQHQLGKDGTGAATGVARRLTRSAVVMA